MKCDLVDIDISFLQPLSPMSGVVGPEEALARVVSVDRLGPTRLAGRRVLLRADLNVPLESQGRRSEVGSDARLRATLPTVRLLLARGAAVVLASHLGRPRGRDPGLSLRPVHRRLAELLQPVPVSFAEDCVGPEAERAARQLAPGAVLLLENTRFHPGEENNDPAFAAELASLAEVYCNDAFASAHRAHASTAAAARLFEERTGGLLLMRELQFLGPAVSRPARPFALVLGGAKTGSKVPLLRRMLDKCDRILIGGGVAFTFLRATGLAVGDSLVEDSQVDTARDLLQLAESRDVQITLPRDVQVSYPSVSKGVADEGKEGFQDTLVEVDEIPEKAIGVDIGPATIRAFCAELDLCKTVVWNGARIPSRLNDWVTSSRAHGDQRDRGLRLGHQPAHGLPGLTHHSRLLHDCRRSRYRRRHRTKRRVH